MAKKSNFASLLDDLNFKNDVSLCKLLGKLLKNFSPWKKKVLRPFSVLNFRMTTLLLLLRVLLIFARYKRK